MKVDLEKQLGFSKHHSHRTETRNSYMVSKWRETGDGEADGPLADKMWGSIWTDDGQVHWTTRTVQEAWLEYLAVSRGDRMQRIPSSIVMENARQTGNQGWRQKEGCGETRTSSRESIQLAVDEERGEEMVANWSTLRIRCPENVLGLKNRNNRWGVVPSWWVSGYCSCDCISHIPFFIRKKSTINQTVFF